MAAIIQACWEQDPMQRPTFDAITVQLESAVPGLGLQPSLVSGGNM
jgi:hypothetical protein